MSISALTQTFGTPIALNAPPLSNPAGSQAAQQTASSVGDANSSVHTGHNASGLTPSGNVPIEPGVASESVTITLSTTAQQTLAVQNQALGQLRQVIEQLRNSNHNAAATRLKQLLQEFHALQQLGTKSARALAALAKEIGAAAADLSESEGGGSGGANPTTDTSFADATLGAASDDSASSQGGAGSANSAASQNAVTSSDVSQSVTGTPVASTQDISGNLPSSGGQDAATAGSQTADSRAATADPSSGSPGPGAAASGAAQRQELVDHLNQQANHNAAQTQATSADRDLLTQAANAVSTIQSIVKQAAEEERKKGKSGAEFDQLAKSVDASATVIEKAIGQVETAPVSTPSISGIISPAGGSINITV